MGPVCILVGAGTGKIRTITHRTKYLIGQGFAQPQKVLVVTFTSYAAGEMRNRLTKMGTPGVQARTFHSAALYRLRYSWPRAAGDMPWQPLDGKKLRVAAQTVRRVGLDTLRGTIRDVMGEIEWVKATLAGAGQYQTALREHGHTASLSAEKIIDCCRVYEDTKITPDGLLLDSDDLLIHTTGAMESSCAVAEGFRN